MSRVSLLAAAVACVAACSSSRTSILVDVSTTAPSASGAQVDTLSLALTIAPAPPQDYPLARPPSLPGKLLLVVPDVAQPVTITLTATTTDGRTLATTIEPTVVPHQEIEVQAVLDWGQMQVIDGGADAEGGSDGGGLLCSMAGSATRCASGNYLFCDGFETSSSGIFPVWSIPIPTIDTYTGGAANPATSLTVDTAPVCAGNQVMHVHAVGLKQQAFLQDQLATRPNPLYLRTFVYLPSSSAQETFYFLSFLNSAGTRWYQIAINPPGSPGFVTNSNFSATLPTFPGEVPRDRWACVETKIRFDSSAGEVAITVDGVSAGDVTGLDTQGNFQMDTFEFGVSAVEVPSGAFDAYFDEVVVSASPIGCF
jgi:hypothetical protein